MEKSSMVLPEQFTECLDGYKIRDTWKLEHGLTVVGTVDIDGKKGIDDFIVVRFYSRGQSVRCFIWVHAGVNNPIGAGRAMSESAKGYGYCKMSTALESALVKLGIKMGRFTCRGRGMTVVDSALLELARQLGVANAKIVSFYA